MRIIETLDWIIDYNDSRIADDEKYKLNIEFGKAPIADVLLGLIV